MAQENSMVAIYPHKPGPFLDDGAGPVDYLIRFA
jgi:hypothetical protein